MQYVSITRALKILIFSNCILSEAPENKGTIEPSLKELDVVSANFWPYLDVGFFSGTFWIFYHKLFPENCLCFTTLPLSAKEGQEISSSLIVTGVLNRGAIVKERRKKIV